MSATGTPPRPILLHAITDRRSTTMPVAAADDFKLAPGQPIERPDIDGCPLVYAADFSRRRILYTVVDPADLLAVFNAPFLYNAQLAHARAVIAVPFGRVNEMEPITGLHPIFIFSSGRAGSTLLARLVNSLGRLSASEPDIFTQFAFLPPDQRAAFPEARIYRAAVASLARYCGRDAIIKLRSQGCLIADSLISSLPGARAEVLLRERTSWAHSRHTNFREPPHQIAKVLRESITAIDDLTRAGAPPQILWYEDLVAHPADTLLQLLANSRLPPTEIAANIATTMARDSQAWSDLAKAANRARAADPDFQGSFDREWSAIRPDALIERYGLARLG